MRTVNSLSKFTVLAVRNTNTEYIFTNEQMYVKIGRNIF